MAQVSLNDCFDHIYCLTLTRRPERWKKVKQEFKKLNIEVERFPAIDGNSLSEGKIKKYPIINKYAIGCMLSHYKIIEDAKKHKYKNILIFEDDVIFHKNFVEEFSNQINKIKNWKILYLGATQTYWDNIEYENGFYYSLGTLGTFAIGINESIYEEVLALTKFNAAIDTKYINLQHKHYKECYTFYPNLVIADVSNSDIRGQRDEKSFREMARWDSSLYDIDAKNIEENCTTDVGKEYSKCPHCGKEIFSTNELRNVSGEEFQCIITRSLSMTSAFIPVQKTMIEKFKNIDEYKNVLLLLGYNVGCDIDEYRKIYPDKKIIIYQLEQLFDNKSQWYNINSSNKEVVRRTNHIKETLHKCDEIWDYDIDNIEFLKSEGFSRIKHVPLPYSENLKRVNKNKNPEYDIIFYGSINERRIKFLEYLKDNYKLLIIAPSYDVEKYKDSIIGNYMVKDVYGDDLFEYIFNSKIVLNLHYYDSKIQEQARIFELLINNKTVVSEKSRINYYGNIIHEFETPEEMIEIIDSLLKWQNYSISNEFRKKSLDNSFIKEQSSKKFKVGAAYSTFYGIELLEKSIRSIKPTVDYVVVVHQKKSFSGNAENPDNDKKLKELLDNKLIDDLIFYDIDNVVQGSVLEKRNIGLDYCKKNMCDFIMPMDADERYNKTELLEELNYMYDNDIKTLYSPIYSYYYDEQHYFVDTYYVASAFIIDDRKFEISQSSVLVDPVRKMKEKKYIISTMPMHHFTYLKDSYKHKVHNSILASVDSSLYNKLIKINNHLQLWKEGTNGLVFTNSTSGDVVLTYMPLKTKLNSISI